MCTIDALNKYLRDFMVQASNKPVPLPVHKVNLEHCRMRESFPLTNGCSKELHMSLKGGDKYGNNELLLLCSGSVNL